MGNDPIISLNLWYIIVAIANVLILYAILKKLLFKRVKDVIDSRENEVSSLFSEAETAKSQAEALKAEYEQNISQAKDKAAEIIKDATVTATKRSDAIIEQANAETVAIKEKAEQAIELERKKAVNELRSDISELVTLAASKVIEREINADDHARLIADFVEKVGE
ncbi:MAG: F0F1 ATP synthase subunit B [Clostridia bacterium]